ncbi:hypothetical protein L596_021048 [Steinernema carpocapsae]|uniref:Uncharacterized protein n=1 Tax=Steinernema carpocapsae TaxID=34508 RepID=A0A4U5MVB1_STECR|nr:hypothetical protein L596_021048 [Steinernema carpocapsae]
MQFLVGFIGIRNKTTKKIIENKTAKPKKRKPKQRTYETAKTKMSRTSDSRRLLGILEEFTNKLFLRNFLRSMSG